MLVYSSNKRGFIEDVQANCISDRIVEAMRQRGLGGVSANERRSFDNSLMYMRNVLEGDEIPADAGIALEYRIPQTSKRIDMLIAGRDEVGRETCVIIELKQWDEVEPTGKDAVVRTFLGGGIRETTHPSYQAWSYASLLEDFNETVDEENIQLRPCAYLHNCRDGGGVRHDNYRTHLDRAPVFIRQDVQRLKTFIQRYVHKGDQDKLLYRIEQGRIRPSRELVNSLTEMLRGNESFLMIDDQKLAFEAALEVTDIGKSGEKQVLIIEGGPGTGKSVVAINLLVQLTARYRNVHYVTPNRAPRQIYETRLTGIMSKTRYSNLFKGSASYDKAEKNDMDALLVDEAHRLVERSTWQKKGSHQIRDLIHAAGSTIFFVDDAQQVTWKDLGSRQEIEHWARQEGATLHHVVLQSQFRCNGSDGYLAWLDHILQRKDTAQDDLAGIDYQLEVFDTPDELRDKIIALDKAGHKARLMAGYCWNWASKNDPVAMDIKFPEHNFAMQWNLVEDEGRYLEKEHSRDQVGCIHTVQGLELDYAGVIIGPDLIVRDGCILTRPEERAKTDRSMDGYKKLLKESPDQANQRAAELIKNTYRTLMSRGLKGCMIYCTDDETRNWFKAQVANARANRVQITQASSHLPEEAPEELATQPQPLALLHKSEVTETSNAVPYIDLPVAAGGFAEGVANHQRLVDADTWIELPDIYRARPDLFVARIAGKSMNRRIPDGALCLFEATPGGSRNGRVMLVYHRDIQDPDHGGGLTVKVYHSEKESQSDNEWRHSRIVLACDTLEAGYEDIVLDGDQAEGLWVVGEYRGVIE